MEILRIARDEFYCIGTSLAPATFGVARNDFHNVPETVFRAIPIPALRTRSSISSTHKEPRRVRRTTAGEHRPHSSSDEAGERRDIPQHSLSVVPRPPG